MPALTKFQSLSEAKHLKKIHFGTDTFKIYFTNTAPDAAADAVKADLPTEIASTGGYSAGGYTVTVASAVHTTGTFIWKLTDLIVTATGGDVGPFRYMCVYSDTSTNDDLIGYLDYGSALTILSGQTFTFDFDPTNGAYQST